MPSSPIMGIENNSGTKNFRCLQLQVSKINPAITELTQPDCYKETQMFARKIQPCSSPTKGQGLFIQEPFPSQHISMSLASAPTRKASRGQERRTPSQVLLRSLRSALEGQNPAPPNTACLPVSLCLCSKTGSQRAADFHPEDVILLPQLPKC